MPGNTAIHDCVVMERAMKARGYEWDKPQGVAFGEGWHDKDLDAQKYGAVYAGIRDEEARRLEAEVESLRRKLEEAKDAIITSYMTGVEKGKEARKSSKDADIERVIAKTADECCEYLSIDQLKQHKGIVIAATSQQAEGEGT